MMAAASAIAQPQPEAYRLYDSKGQPVDFGTMTDSLSKQNVVFVGEMHNCPVTHWLELKILQSLYSAKKDKVAVGMEMLEADNQLIIDEYLDGVITSDRFENECRLWPNYSTDYEPLVEFANEHKLRVFATNVPRRYANSVKNNGCNILDSLSEEARRYLPPLPLKLKENEQTKEAFGMMSMMRKNAHPEFMAQSHGLEHLKASGFSDGTLQRQLSHRWRRWHHSLSERILERGEIQVYLLGKARGHQSS